MFTLKQELQLQILKRKISESEKAFETFLLSIKNAYTRAWDKQSKKAIVKVLDELRDYSEDQIRNFSPATQSKMLGAVESQIGAKAMQTALQEPVANLSEQFYKLGMKEVAKTPGVDIEFGRPDKKARKAVKNSNLFWTGEH